MALVRGEWALHPIPAGSIPAVSTRNNGGVPEGLIGSGLGPDTGADPPVAGSNPVASAFHIQRNN